MFLSLPPFGSNAAGSACDGTVYMRQVGMVPCVVPGTNLKAREKGNNSQFILIISKAKILK